MATTEVVFALTAAQSTTIWTSPGTAGGLGSTIIYGPTTSVILGAATSLYLPLSATTASIALNVTQAISRLTTPTLSATLTASVYDQLPGGSLISYAAANVTEWTIFPGNILYVPVVHTLTQTVTMAALQAVLSSYITTLPSATVPSLSRSNTALMSITGGSTTTTPGFESSSTSAPSDSLVSGVSESASASSTQSSLATANGGVSTGGLVGGVIGALFVGLLIGTLIIWLYLRRRQRQSRRATSEPYLQESKAAGLAGLNGSHNDDIPLAAGLTSWRKHLPQEKAEKDIVRDFASIFDLIKIYVETFYGQKQKSVSSSQLVALQAIADDQTIDLLRTNRSTTHVLERIVASFVIARVSLRSEPAESLLPSDFTSTPSKLGLQMEGGDLGNTSSSSRHGFLPAFADWRVLTGFLTSGAGTRTQDELDGKIEAALRTLTTSLSSFEVKSDRSNRDRNLRAILVQAAAADKDLFLHPSTLVFKWSDDSREQAMVIFPALVKVLDEEGRRMEQPRVLLRAQT